MIWVYATIIVAGLLYWAWEPEMFWKETGKGDQDWKPAAIIPLIVSCALGAAAVLVLWLVMS